MFDDYQRRDDFSAPAYVTPTFVGQAEPEPADDMDDFTPEELKSLLDNFSSLSKQEQEDLILYMKKLETTNPDKVRDLWPLLKEVRNPQVGRSRFCVGF